MTVASLLIACVGLNGAVTYTITRGTSEFGIRMVLLAQRCGRLDGTAGNLRAGASKLAIGVASALGAS